MRIIKFLRRYGKSFILMGCFLGVHTHLAAQKKIYVDSTISIEFDAEFNDKNSYEVNSALSRLFVNYKPTPAVYKGTGINLKGRKMVYVYKPMFSLDNKNWFYYSYMEMYPYANRFDGLFTGRLYWTTIQNYLYQCTFDGNPMKSKYCVGLSGYGNGPCRPDIPVYFKYQSNSDTLYRPNNNLLLTLPCMPNKGIYNRLEIWSYDPKDSVNTVCVTRSVSKYVKTFANMTPDPNRGEAKVISGQCNPDSFIHGHSSSYKYNYVVFALSLLKPQIPAWAVETPGKYPYIISFPGDTVSRRPVLLPVSSYRVTGRYNGSNYRGFDSAYFPLVNGIYENTIKYEFDPNITDTSVYTETFVKGKPYLYSNWFVYKSPYWADSAFDHVDNWPALKDQSYLRDSIHRYFYLQIRPGNYTCSTKVDYTGLKVLWDNMSAASKLNQIRVIAQDIDNPTSWRVVGNFSKTVTSVKDVDAIPGVKYIYRVQLMNSAGKVMEETFCYGIRNGTGHLDGKVTTKSGSGIANAVVYLKLKYDVSGTILQYIDTTDNSGYYEFNNLPLSATFCNYTIYPYLPGHKYSPAVLERQLSLTQSSRGGIDFIDTTVFSVEGTIRIGNSCPVEGARIYMDGKATPYLSDKLGKYNAIVETFGKHIFTVDYKPANKKFSFEPNEYTLDVRNNFKSKDFNALDSTTVRISALTRCGMPFADSVQIRIYSIKNGNTCKTEKLTLMAKNSSFNFIRLPRQKYIVEVMAIYPANTNILNKINSPVDLDLTNDSNNIRRIDYVYIGQPKVVISNLPRKICLQGDSTRFMDQKNAYEIDLNVVEVHTDYRPHTCPVDTGILTVFDQIGDLKDVVELKVKKGEAVYTIHPNTPNLSGNGLHPYQKNINFTYSSNDTFKLLSPTETVWAFVQGHRPRQQTFVTKTPELPFFILHDPPGSQSLSYLEKETEFSQTITNSMSIGNSASGFLNLRVGVEFPVPFTGLVFGGGVGVDFALTGGSTQDKESVDTKITIKNESFATSANPDYVGEDGDVVVGASINMTYALTDVLVYDSSKCGIERDTSLVWGENGFNTTYAYTIRHIRDELIPNLTTLRDLQTNKDSVLLIQSWINVWQQVVEQNHKAIENASKIENKSISNGTEYRNSTSTSESSEISISYEAFLQTDLSLYAVIGSASRFNETQFGVRHSFNWTTRNTSTTNTTSTRTVGYVLLDEDDGDNLSVDILEDKKWGTIAFKTIAGITTCPHENNTQKRMAAGASVEQPVLRNVPENGQAVYSLTVTDKGEGNTKLQDQYFNISVDPNSNLDGAIISIAGNILSASTPYKVSIPWGGSITLPVVVKRGPLAYDYENIEILVTPTCDQDAGESSFEDGLSDKVKISAHFIADCPVVTLNSPYNGQIVGGDNELLLFTFSGYDINNTGFNSVVIQYKGIKDRYWSSVKTINRSELKNAYFDYTLDISAMDTGYYVCRLQTNCNGGKSYTPQVGFIVSRVDYSGTHFKVFKPVTRLVSTWPDDGVLGVKDEIKAIYTGPVMNIPGTTVFNLKDETSGKPVPIKSTIKDGQIQLDMEASVRAQLDGHWLEAQLINVFDTAAKTITNRLNWRFQVVNSKCYWSNSRLKIQKAGSDIGIIEAELVNETNAALDYELTLPWWIAADNLNGKINANSKINISLYVAKNLPGHFQSDFVKLKQVQTGKTIQLEIICDEFVKMDKMPVVNSSFSDSMYSFLQFIPYKMKASTKLSDDSGDILFVYVGDECRGSGHVRYDPVIDKWYATVLVFGHYDKSNSSVLNFKVWDASEGLLYDAIETSVFNKAQIGCADRPFILNLYQSKANSSIEDHRVNKGDNWFKIYPNPTQDKLNIYTQIESGYSVTIYSVNGVELYSAEIKPGMSTITLDVSQLPAGIYIVKLLNGAQAYYSILIVTE